MTDNSAPQTEKGRIDAIDVTDASHVVTHKHRHTNAYAVSEGAAANGYILVTNGAK
jgi:hypothetical protein